MGHICRFLSGPEANNGVSVFKWLEKVQSVTFCDTGKQYKAQNLASTHTVYWNTVTLIRLRSVSGCTRPATAELRGWERKPKTCPVGASTEQGG